MIRSLDRIFFSKKKSKWLKLSWSKSKWLNSLSSGRKSKGDRSSLVGKSLPGTSLLKHIFCLPLGSSSCFAYFHREISLFTTQRTISWRLLQPIQAGPDNESLSMFYYPRSMPLFARSLQTSLFILSAFTSTIYDRVEATYIPLLISKIIVFSWIFEV